MITTRLNIHDTLPLTCSRTGTCCHGKMVLLNPWELACLAKAKGVSSKEFRDLYCEHGGIKLRFDGKAGWKGQKACSQYVPNFGCSVHLGRPLSCRLYPLGRQIQSGEVQYMYEGAEFPCLEGCPEVVGLSHLKVGEYLQGQMVDKFEKAQDEYLIVMQDLADIAFAFFLETGLAAWGDTKTLLLWEKMGNELPEVLAATIGADWIDCLMLPDIDDLDDPVAFSRKHNELLQQKAQEEFGTLQTMQEFSEASVLMMGVALHLARAIGANPNDLAGHWVEIAKSQQ